MSTKEDQLVQKLKTINAAYFNLHKDHAQLQEDYDKLYEMSVVLSQKYENLREKYNRLFENSKLSRSIQR